MTKKEISQAVGAISDRHISEAADYRPVGKKRGVFPLGRAAAAVLALCLAVGGIVALISPEGGGVTAYAYGTDQELTAAGVVLTTGSIDDRGAQKGHPLMFYLAGEDIATVRFSCKNEKLCFLDWTEQREEFGNAQNFTVPYGEKEEEYYYLTIDWVPEKLRRLLQQKDVTIAALPAEAREDTIVMEFTFLDGRSSAKAITVTLLDDGSFQAVYGDYSITGEDDFVRRPDSPAIPREILYGPY